MGNNFFDQVTLNFDPLTLSFDLLILAFGPFTPTLIAVSYSNRQTAYDF